MKRTGNCICLCTLKLAFSKQELVRFKTQTFAHDAGYKLPDLGLLAVRGQKLLIPFPHQGIDVVHHVAQDPPTLWTRAHFCNNQLSISIGVREAVQLEEQARVTKANSRLPAVKEAMVNQRRQVCW